MRNKELTLIIRLPTEELSAINEFGDTMRNADTIVIPKHIPILVKGRNGYWTEI